ncbi:MAG: DUF4783 domain-containing protein [Bacteroidota bacterium]
MLLHNDIQLPSHADRAPNAPGRCVEQETTAVAAAFGKWSRLHSGHFAFMFVQMRTRRIFIPIALAAAMLTAAPLLPVNAWKVSGQEQSVQQDPERPARELLLGAKDALSSGNIRYLRPHLGQKVYLNLFTGINGYYSGEQAFLILESLFSTHTPISFSFSSRNFSIRNPYGFGPLTYEYRGKRETAEIFLSLANVRGEWVINHISIAMR